MKLCVQKKKKVNDTIATIDNIDDTIDTNDVMIDTDTNHKLNQISLDGRSFCGKI